MIIVPNGNDPPSGRRRSSGPARSSSRATPRTSADFVANPDYWGGAPTWPRPTLTFYASQQPQILALQSGAVDVVAQFVASGRRRC